MAMAIVVTAKVATNIKWFRSLRLRAELCTGFGIKNGLLLRSCIAPPLEKLSSEKFQLQMNDLHGRKMLQLRRFWCKL